MTSMYKANISATGRVTSMIAGATLAALGYRRSNRTIGLAGLGLLARGASGWCPITAAIDADAPHDIESTKQHLGGTRGVMVDDATVIYRPVSEVYSYWRNLENLPRFMQHLDQVRVIDRLHSHWSAKGPLGVTVGWDAEIINDIPPTLLSWKSIGESDVVSAGSVRFKPAGERATEVRVKLQYDLPAGKLGATVARLLGEDPHRQIAEDLVRFKQLLETGEVTPSDSVGDTASSQRPRHGFEPADLAGDFGSTR